MRQPLLYKNGKMEDSLQQGYLVVRFCLSLIYSVFFLVFKRVQIFFRTFKNDLKKQSV